MNSLSPEKKRELDKLLINGQSDWQSWLTRNFPHVCTAPPAERHVEFWEWIEALEPGVAPPAFGAIWPRGGAKSSTIELGAARVGQKLSRRFALYVSATQTQANLHVQAIAALFERLGIERALTKYGHSKGWRIDQLRTSNGFNVAACGLDAAIRGVKLENYRPDLIILDDVDEREDTPKTTGKKEEAIKSSILAAGAPDLAVAFLQNLIHSESIASRLVDGRADFLANRTPIKVIKAIENLETEYRADEVTGVRKAYITAGEPTWQGQDLEVCQRQIWTLGLDTFLREAQQEVENSEGFFFDSAKLEAIDELPYVTNLVRAWDFAATQDGGDWTAGVLMGYAEGLYCIPDIKRAQLASNNVRELLKQTAREDFRKYGKIKIRLSQDPGQAGKDQAEQLTTILKELDAELNEELRLIAVKENRPFVVRECFDVVISSITGSKAVRARGLADATNSGNVRLLNSKNRTHSKEILAIAPKMETDWNAPFRLEMKRFREDEGHLVDDQVDGGADAFNEMPKVQHEVKLRVIRL